MQPNGALPWIDLLTAARESTKDSPSFPQLATIRGPSSNHLQGRPACRTVNIRMIKNGKLYFSSDLRSGKADDVSAGDSAFVELCWYFPQLSQQYRLSGTLALLSACDESKAAWDRHEPRERLWWAWPHPADKWDEGAALNATPSESAPPHFCVCELTPDHVEVLDLSVVPFRREFHEAAQTGEGGGDKAIWTVKRVNP